MILVKTKGSAPSQVIEKTVKEVADAIMREVNGRPARQEYYPFITQEFVDKHELIANYHSGTFLGFSVPDEMIDELKNYGKSF